MQNSSYGSGTYLISGLWHEEQLEIGAQAARKRRPDVSRNELLELARKVREQNRSQTQ